MTNLVNLTQGYLAYYFRSPFLLLLFLLFHSGGHPQPLRHNSEHLHSHFSKFHRRSLPSTPLTRSPRLSTPQQHPQQQQQHQARFIKYANEIFASKLPTRVSVEESEEALEVDDEETKKSKEELDEEEGKKWTPSLKRNRRIATPGSLHLHPDLEGKYAASGRGG